jgi:hypothetical protein
MYIATQDFKAYILGNVKKDQELEFNKAWLDAGLIKEVQFKPEPKKEIEVKPVKQQRKTK